VRHPRPVLDGQLGRARQAGARVVLQNRPPSPLGTQQQDQIQAARLVQLGAGRCGLEPVEQDWGARQASDEAPPVRWFWRARGRSLFWLEPLVLAFGRLDEPLLGGESLVIGLPLMVEAVVKVAEVKSASEPVALVVAGSVLVDLAQSPDLGAALAQVMAGLVTAPKVGVSGLEMEYQSRPVLFGVTDRVPERWAYRLRHLQR
jgi:hypothetical protein